MAKRKVWAVSTGSGSGIRDPGSGIWDQKSGPEKEYEGNVDEDAFGQSILVPLQWALAHT